MSKDAPDPGTEESNPETGAPLGDDSTIPQSEKGVSVGVTDTDSNFNPEEDEASDA